MGLEDSFDLDSIRDFVMNELSEQNGLLPNAFPMTQRVLQRHDVACGVFYCLHGPRSIRLTAILDTVSSRVLMYDSRGERTASYDLSEINIGKTSQGSLV
jgi:hypothetical protein